MKVSVVIPVYNEAGTVAQVIERVRAVPLDKEIIVVNDGSTDETGRALTAFEGVDGIRVHHSPINLGKGGAVRIGFTMVRGDIVLIQDADLELDPAEHPQLCAPIERGEADVVLGSRFLTGRRGDVFSYAGNRGLTALTNLLFGAHITDMESCFKVFRAAILPTLRLRGLRFEIEPELIASFLKGGWRIVEVPVSYTPRTSREGKKIRSIDGLSAVATLLRCRIGR
jgi:glycosyltransferase involved in cell wall biosynthesis